MPGFIDTNVAVYAMLGGPKAPRALEVLSGATINVQVLNEFTNVCLRNLHYDRRTIDQLVAEIRAEVVRIEPVTEATHDLAREIVFRYQLGFYDSALLAAALLADCETFYSEDLQHGLMIERQLTIINPFA